MKRIELKEIPMFLQCQQTDFRHLIDPVDSDQRLHCRQLVQLRVMTYIHVNETVETHVNFHSFPKKLSLF